MSSQRRHRSHYRGWGDASDGFSQLEAPNDSRWWLVVAVVATALPVSLALVWLVRATGGSSLGTLVVSLYWVVVVGCWLFSPIAVHFDRQYVAEVSGWTPPAWYYAVFVVGPGMVLAIAYVVHRYRRVGLR